jgi:hypothetical protein
MKKGEKIVSVASLTNIECEHIEYQMREIGVYKSMSNESIIFAISLDAIGFE